MDTPTKRKRSRFCEPDEGPSSATKRTRSTSTPQEAGTPKKLADPCSTLDESPLKTTPKKLGLDTTETDVRASAVKRASLLSQTPQKLRQTVAKLPAKFALLVELFGYLQTVYMLMRSRGQVCTFQVAQKAVEEASRRTFVRRHLLQMKEVFPDALKLQNIVVKAGSLLGSASKPEPRLIIEMPLLRGENPGNARQELKQQLADLLVARVQRHYNAHRRSEPDEARDTADWDASFDPNSTPDIPEAELSTIAAAASPMVMGRSRLPTTPTTKSPAVTPTSSARKPPLGARSIARASMAKKLMFGSGKETVKAIPAATGEPGSSGTGADDKQPVVGSANWELSKDEEIGKELMQQCLAGDLPVSLASLQKLQEVARENEVLCSLAAKTAQRRSSALQKLPQTFDRIRQIIRAPGPRVMPRSEVIKRMLGPKHSDSHRLQAENEISVLAEKLPEFLELEERQEVGIVLKIDRRPSRNMLRAKLVALAKEDAEAHLDPGE